ncbi:MAG TPA: DUF378 domain-containing protein [Myxococcaceae bacterium]|nr:DUF378 domain-containing protein [Myxococcaceae bacterium]
MAEKTQTGMSIFNKVLAVLVIIGALNWGLVGFFEWNLVEAVFTGRGSQEASGVAQFIYIVVGLAGLALAFTFPWAKQVAAGEPRERRPLGRRREVHP